MKIRQIHLFWWRHIPAAKWVLCSCANPRIQKNLAHDRTHRSIRIGVFVWFSRIVRVETIILYLKVAFTWFTPRSESERNLIIAPYPTLGFTVCVYCSRYNSDKIVMSNSHIPHSSVPSVMLPPAWRVTILTSPSRTVHVRPRCAPGELLLSAHRADRVQQDQRYPYLHLSQS